MFSTRESVAKRWCFILKTFSCTRGALWTHFIFYSLKRHFIQFHLLQMSQRASLVKQVGKAPEQTSFSEEKVYQLMPTLLLCREAPRGSLSHLYNLESYLLDRQTWENLCKHFQWTPTIKSFKRSRMSEGTLLWSIKSLNQDELLTKRNRFYISQVLNIFFTTCHQTK